jgi:hypothetical protein
VPEVTALVATLRDVASDARARQRAVRALREHGSPEATAALLEMAADSAVDVAIRADALHALRRKHDERRDTRVEEAIVQGVVTEHLDAAERYASAGAALRDGSNGTTIACCGSQSRRRGRRVRRPSSTVLPWSTIRASWMRATARSSAR